MKSLFKVPTGKTYSRCPSGGQGARKGLGLHPTLLWLRSNLSEPMSPPIPPSQRDTQKQAQQASDDSFRKEAQGEPFSLRERITFKAETAF